MTFNDDQSKLSFATLDHSPTDEEKRQFEGDVAIRVLDRALAACGVSVGVRQKNHKRDSRVVGCNAVSSAALENVIVDSPFLLPALAMARSLLGAPEDTGEFLVVDEIGKCVSRGAKKNEGRSQYHQLSCISPLHVLRRGPTPLPALSTYGATSISTLATYSTRPLKLQPLPPVFPVTSLVSNAVGQLPPILRRFASRPERRRELPGGPDNYELYVTVSRILLHTGGHPRSVSRVFLHLCAKFAKNVDELPADGFCTALRTAIDGNIEGACKTMVDGTESITPDHLEDLARDTACEFAFPTIKGHHHETMLVNTCKGLCQFISPRAMVGHAFIPYPVLVNNYHGGAEPCAQAESGPCGGGAERLQKRAGQG